jgi:glutamyl-tRNA reductase
VGSAPGSRERRGRVLDGTLVAIGTDHGRAAVEDRERLAFPGDALAAGLAALRACPAVREGLILSTCNRTEVYAVVATANSAAESLSAFLATHRGVPPALLDAVATVRTGDDAARHLFRVASGLESMVLGEPQILGQVRGALGAAQAAGSAGPTVARLTTDALRVGKAARTATGIARNKTSIPHAGVALAEHRLAGLTGRRAVVVGAGKMAGLTARLLRGVGIGELVVANRTLAKAAALAQETGGRAAPLGALARELAVADVAFGAVTSTHYVLDRAALNGNLAGRTVPLIAIDLGVPRTIDPAVADHPLVTLFDVDDLAAPAATARAAYAAEVARAEAMVEDAIRAFAAWREARAVAPTVAALRARAEATRDAEVARALAKLGHLSERDREVVRALGATLTGKLLHPPVARLRSETGPQRAASAAALARLWDLDPTDPGADADPGAVVPGDS